MDHAAVSADRAVVCENLVRELRALGQKAARALEGDRTRLADYPMGPERLGSLRAAVRQEIQSGQRNAAGCPYCDVGWPTTPDPDGTRFHVAQGWRAVEPVDPRTEQRAKFVGDRAAFPAVTDWPTQL